MATTGSGVLGNVGVNEREEVESDGTSEGGSRDIGMEERVASGGEESLKTFSVFVEAATPDFKFDVAGRAFVARDFRGFAAGRLMGPGVVFCSTSGSAEKFVGVAFPNLALLRVLMWNASLGSREERLLEVAEAMSLESIISKQSN